MAIVRRVLLFCLAAVIGPLPAAVLSAPADTWTGVWDTHWPEGSARLTLTQEGPRVTGAYMPFDGRVEGTVAGRVLSGEWRDRSGQGTFRIRLGRDGETFVGNFGSGLWWTGEKVTEGDGESAFVADRSSPRAVLRSFLIAANNVRIELLDYVEPALDCLLQEAPAGAKPGPATRDRTLLFFDTLDRTTFRLADIPAHADSDLVELSLGQAGTDESMGLTFLRQEDGWRILVPAASELEAIRRRFVAARGMQGPDPLGYLRLENPRATIRTFLEEYKRWPAGGAEQVRRTLDLSHLNPAMVPTEFPLLATYLKQTLDRVSYVIYQEIPDDPHRQLPFALFRHPRGDIFVAPVQADSVAAWKFTAQTVAGIRDVYESLEDLPLASELIPDQKHATYFRVNQFVRRHLPFLTTTRFGQLEDWQLLAVLATVLLAVLVARGFDWLAGVVQRRQLRRRDVLAKHDLRKRLFAPLAVTLGVGVGYLCAVNIGLPLALFPALHAVVVFILTAGLVWTTFSVTSLCQEYFAGQAEKTVSYYDELLVSVLGGLARVVIMVVGLLLLADSLGVPVGGLLAGVGVGGLAFAIAAKDTVANIIGSGVLLMDRPFKRGDLVVVAGHEGYIERMGLRSTQMRTRDDSVVSIPNSILVNEFIDNMGRRRLRRVVGRVGVTYDTPVAKLEAFATGMLETLGKQPRVSSHRISAGIWEYAESSIDFEFVCYIDAPTGPREREERHKLFLAITALAEKMGVELAFPTRTIHLADADARGRRPGAGIIARRVPRGRPGRP